MRFLILIFCVFYSLSSFAQNHIDSFYYNDNWDVVQHENATNKKYIYYFSKDIKGYNAIVKFYKLPNQLIKTTYYQDYWNSKIFKDSIFWANGNLKKAMTLYNGVILNSTELDSLGGNTKYFDKIKSISQTEVFVNGRKVDTLYLTKFGLTTTPKFKADSNYFVQWEFTNFSLTALCLNDFKYKYFDNDYIILSAQHNHRLRFKRLKNNKSECVTKSIELSCQKLPYVIFTKPSQKKEEFIFPFSTEFD